MVGVWMEQGASHSYAAADDKIRHEWAQHSTLHAVEDAQRLKEQERHHPTGEPARHVAWSMVTGSYSPTAICIIADDA